MLPPPSAAHEPGPEDIPDLPPEVEDELYEILFDAGGGERDRRLASLLREHPEHHGALADRIAMITASESALEQVRLPLAETPLPERISRYRIDALLGEGGFGTVYRAEQDEPVQRRVALKVLHPGRIDERSQWRFQAERQVLARMQHPNVAQIFDAGRTPEGLHYFAMELIDGETITRWCDRERLGIDARLDLFLQVCAAVQHAHQRGVVHRDLKPSNVLVTPGSGRGVAKVIDFGVAKLLEREDGSSLATRDGALIGTPGYMSPEQASGEPIDTRTDVYALGVLLYELLTGDLPFSRTRIAAAGLADMARFAREAEPRRLSTAVREAGADLDAIAMQRSSSPSALLRRLRGDLEWVLRRALARRPDDRYVSVSALVADIERYRRSEPVAAREPAVLYLTRRFVARHRLGIALAIALALAVLAGVAFLLWTLGAVERARRDAVADREIAVRKEYAAHMAAAQAALGSGDATNARAHLEAAPAIHRDWEWRYLWSLSDTSIATYSGPASAGLADTVWLDNDEPWLLSYNGRFESGSRRMFDPRAIRIASNYQRFCLDACRSRLFAIVDDYLRVIVLDLATGATRPLFAASPDARRRTDVRSLRLAPDQRTLAISDNTGTVRLLDTFGELPPRVLCHSRDFAWDIQFTLDGSRLLLANGQGWLETRRISDGVLVGDWFLGADGITALALDRSGRCAFAAAGKRLCKLDLASGALLQRIDPGNSIECLEVSSDGKTIYTCGNPTTRVSAWSTATLEEVGYYPGQESTARRLALSPDGSRIAVRSLGEIRIWDTRPRRGVVLLPAGFHVNDLAIAPDGESVATANSKGRVIVWNARTCQREAIHDLDVYASGCAMTRSTIYVGGNRLLAVDRRSGKVRQGPTLTKSLGRLCVDPEERWLVAGSTWWGDVFVWRLPDLELLVNLELPVSDRIAFDAGSGCFVLPGVDGTTRWLDPESGQITAAVEDTSGTGYVHSIRGGTILIGDREPMVRAAPGEPFLPFGPQGDFKAIALSPDGRRIATCDDKAIVRLWGRDGTEVLALDDAPKLVTELAFIAGGTRLVGLSQLQGAEGYVVVWGVGL
ncbi:MAG: protein kinase [Planctomycetes bacterium]|nr:protein kinase [Planctomycetota bacterium]